MKPLFLLLPLLLAAPLRADDAETLKKLEELSRAEIPKQTAIIDSYRDVLVGKDYSNFSREQKAYIEGALASQMRAAYYQNSGDYKAAGEDWRHAATWGRRYLKGVHERPLETEKWAVSGANAFWQAGEYVEASRTLNDVELPQATPSDMAVYNAIRARLALREPDPAYAGEALRYSRASLEAARSANLTKLQATATRLQSAALFLQGDASYREVWQSASNYDGKFADVHPFDPKQLPFNGAVAQNPRDAKARLERARYFLRRGENLRAPLSLSDDFLNRVPGEERIPANRGGWFNLAELSTAHEWSFDEAAIEDCTVGLPKAKDHLTRGQLFATRMVAMQNFNAAVPVARRFTQNQIDADYAGAFENSGNNGPALTLLAEDSQKRAETATEPRQKTPLVLQAIQLFARAILAYSGGTSDEKSLVPGLLQRAEAMDKLIIFPTAPPPPKPPQTALEWKERGNQLNEKGDLRGAVKAYERAIALNPNFADAYNNLGNQFVILGRYDLALESLNRALALDPKHRIAWYIRSDVYQYLGENKAALEDAKQAVEWADTPARKLSALLSLADCQKVLGDREATLASLQKATEIAPQAGEIWMKRGVLQFEAGQFLEAQTTLQRAVNLMPLAPRPAMLLAMIINMTEIAEREKKLGVRPGYVPIEQWAIIVPDAQKVWNDAALRISADDERWLANLYQKLWQPPLNDILPRGLVSRASALVKLIRH